MYLQGVKFFYELTFCSFQTYKGIYKFLEIVKVNSMNSRYTSALDHVRKVKFGGIAHLTSIKKMFQSCHA